MAHASFSSRSKVLQSLSEPGALVGLEKGARSPSRKAQGLHS